MSWLPLEGAANARAVVPRVLLRSDNLQGLSARDIEWLLNEGSLEVVLDLRTDVEVEMEGPGPLRQHTDRVRIEHRSLHPDSRGNTDLDVDAIRPWQDDHDVQWSDESPVVRAYMSYLSRRPDSVVAAIRTIARSEGAVLVHCAAGKDRTGVVVALALDAVGVPRRIILDDYLATGERVEGIVERLLSSPTYRADIEATGTADLRAHWPVRSNLERVLQLLDERYGGSAAWLAAEGLSDEDLARLQRRLAKG